MAGTGTEVGQRVATTAILGLARVQHDAALSPTVALHLAGRLDRLADQLARGKGADQDWAKGLANLLKDREALDRAIADPARQPRIPPGMPIGTDDAL